MTDPTPIAADTHVSGGVEVTRTISVELLEAANLLHRKCEFDLRDACREAAVRLAATPVPANAEGVREAIKIIEEFCEAAEYAAGYGRSQPVPDDISNNILVSTGPLMSDAYDKACTFLYTRPTDTAAREAAVEAATVERCAKVVERIAADHGRLRDAVAAIRALTPAHIADATEGDDDEPAAWAVAALKAADEAYAAFMGDPNDDGFDDPSDAKRAAALVIQRAVLAASRTTGEGGTAARDEGMVAIWSGEHRAYWRRSSDGVGCGYTGTTDHAGVWTRADAIRLTSHCGPEKLIALHDRPALAASAPAAREGE